MNEGEENMIKKHTPGPWKAIPSNHSHNGRVYTEDGSQSICFDTHDDNARLIAAAPELLKAVETALQAFNERECYCDGEYEDGRLVGHACYFHRIEQELRDALAKATGGDE